VNPQRPEKNTSPRQDVDDKNRPGRDDPLSDPHRQRSDDIRRESQQDPLEGDPGAHPAATASGAVIGGAAGAAMGAIAGPVGAVLGAGIGAVAGRLAGRGIGEAVNPTEEETYWRQQFAGTEHARRGRTFEACQSAYRYGWESCLRHGGRSFDEVEDELGREWDSHRGRSDLGWMEARPAARDAWSRVQGRVHQRGRSEGRIIT
jgi:hypothetical protein